MSTLKRNLWILVLALSTFIAACDKSEDEPIPSTVAKFTFTATNTQTAPCVVTFTNQSIEATNYAWEFGDGRTSTDKDPVMSFATPGTFKVKLVATNSKNTDIMTNTSTVTVDLVIADPNAGKSRVLYFGDRATGKVHKVILNGQTPTIQNVSSGGIGKPYGIAIDETNRKIYVGDNVNFKIYRYDFDGTNQTSIWDGSSDATIDGPYGLAIAEGKLYFTSNKGIHMVNFDGTGHSVAIPTVSTTAPEFPLGLAYNPKDKKFYFTNDKLDFTGGVWSVKMDGTGFTKLVDGVDGTAIALDTTGTGKIYFADYGIGIKRCDMSGANPTKIGDVGAKATWGIAVDAYAKKVYWSFTISNLDPDCKIIQANLDGSSSIDWITNVNAKAITIDTFR